MPLFWDLSPVYLWGAIGILPVPEPLPALKIASDTFRRDRAG